MHYATKKQFYLNMVHLKLSQYIQSLAKRPCASTVKKFVEIIEAVGRILEFFVNDKDLLSEIVRVK